LAWFVLNIAMGSSTKWLFLHGRIQTMSTKPSRR